MKLRDLVPDIASLDPDLTVYIDSEWSPESNILLCVEPEDGSSPEGFEHFLEVFLLQELFEDMPDITVERIIKYAQEDC
ncbi:hypothetical protein [Vibrio caribbeanicus]|uniref:hypothetical protein n=1 Tax=Vibrio caribbeanicus TaxID=701175 RepID=UPI0022851203|nr:hypothetical protein [Vibrio caribbeanicus]MCY9846387.1 hypothetical protein [Vibrio caribbeanicus]